MTTGHICQRLSKNNIVYDNMAIETSCNKDKNLRRLKDASITRRLHRNSVVSQEMENRGAKHLLNLQQMLGVRNACDCVVYAFSWDESKEGYTYWRNKFECTCV